MNKDYYEILGVSRNATDEEITKAYRKIAVKSHPDKQQGKSEEEKQKAEETFKLATEAKDVLLDKEKRRMYDTFGTVDGTGFSQGGDDTLEEFIKRNFSHMHGMGDSFFQQQTPKGPDKRVRMRVSFEEVYNMANRQFTYQRSAPCPDCHGSGSFDGKNHACPYCHGQGYIMESFRRGAMLGQTSRMCPHCNGSGFVIAHPCSKCGGSGVKVVEEQYTLRITPQVVLQGGVRVPGMGNAPMHGKGNNGDLIITIELQPHNLYSIDEHFNLIIEQTVPLVDCLLGCKVDIPLINGKTQVLTIRECTADGTKFRLSGMGMRRPDNTFGDLFVVVKHSMPSKLSKDERKALEKLNKMENFKKC